MTSKVKFLINSKIQILMEDGTYKSNVQDVSTKHIAISIPVCDGRYLSLRVGEKVEGIYFYNDNVYKFSTTVLDRKKDGVMIIVLAYPRFLKKIQRRNFVRVSYVNDIWCISLGMANEYKTIKYKEYEFFNAMCLDLSGSGAKICSDRENKLGEVLMLTIPVKDEILTFTGKIVRKDPSNIIGKFNYGICFIDVNKKEVEKLIMLLFELMRERRKSKTREE